MQEITLKAAAENIPVVTAMLDEWLEALECPMKAQMQLDVAVDEIFANISSYAYEEGIGDVTVRMEFDEASRTAALIFMDRGMQFDPMTSDEPDVSLPAEERDIGGLGIFLVKKTMDDVAYRYEDGMNVLTIRKRI